MTVNGVYYPIPISFEAVDRRWLENQRADTYFLEPFVGEEYYETRADWSLIQKMGRRFCRVGPSSGSLEKTGCC